jgi:uncharacterized protein YciI
MIRSIRPALAALALLLAPGLAPGEEPAAPPPKYEMTTYYVGLLYRGARWTPEITPETQKIQEGHMANIRKMAAAGKLVVAGPFSDDGDLRGMFVFTTASLEEARALCDQDPAIRAGRLKIELHPWYAAAGIKVNPPK